MFRDATRSHDFVGMGRFLLLFFRATELAINGGKKPRKKRQRRGEEQRGSGSIPLERGVGGVVF